MAAAANSKSPTNGSARKGKSSGRSFPRYDLETVRGAVDDWPQLLVDLGKMPEYLHDARHEHPCPKCGGESRCRFVNKMDGAIRCSHCFSDRCGDGFSTLAWLLDLDPRKDFPKVVAMVAEYVGVQPSDGQGGGGQKKGDGKKAGRGQKEESKNGSGGKSDSRPKRTAVELAKMAAAREMGEDTFLAAVCEAKSMPVESAKVYGAKVRWWGSSANGGTRVVEFPGYDGEGKHPPNSRFGISHVADDEKYHKGAYPKKRDDDDVISGLFLPHDDDGNVRLPRPGEVWLAVEGAKDATSLHGLGYGNTAGLPTNSMNARFAPLFAGVDVVLVPDLDMGGQLGAKKTAERLAGVAASVRIARLPGEVRGSSGDDVRDALARPGGEALVRAAIAEAVPAASWSPILPPAPTGNATTSASLAGSSLIAGESPPGASQAPDDVPPPEPLEIISSSEFFAANYCREYIIDGILTAGEPCVIGGQSKTLKTTLAIDLALAIGTGTQFLGQFEVKKQRRVVVLSGESGDYTLQETARRIAASRNIVDVGNAETYWGFDLPCLGSDDGIGQLMATVEGVEAEVLIVDPAYLSLMGEATRGLNAGNIFDIGPLLLNLSRECKARNLTLILLHHCRKNSPNEKFSPPELAELSMAGFGEFARQWILLGRREAYLCDGKHRLWLVAGGSAGHGGQWALDVDEGEFDSGSHRKYDVTLRTAVEEQAAKKTIAEARKAADQEERQRKNQQRVIDTMRRCPDGDTASAISDAASISRKYFGPIIHSLVNDGIVERCFVTKGNRTHDGWRLRSDSSDQPAPGANSSTSGGQGGQGGQMSLLSECPGDAGDSDSQSDGQGDYINSPRPSACSSESPAGDDHQANTSPVGQPESSQSPPLAAGVNPSSCSHRFVDKPSPGRTGWVRTECDLCGKWQGDRPVTATGEGSTANGRPRKEGARAS